MKKLNLLFFVFALFLYGQLISQNLSEGFETWPPADWTFVQGPCSPTNDISQSSTYANSGTYSARMSSYTNCSSGYDQYMISPQLEVTSGDQTISFWYRKYTSGSEKFMLGWSSTGTNLSTDFTWSNEISNASTSWQQFIKSDLPVGTKYVAIHYYSYYQYYLYLDDFAGPALYVPSCPKPVNLNLSSLSSTSAELNWDESGSALLWDIEFGAGGFTPTGTPTDIGVSKPFLIDGLSPNAPYSWYVRADCGGEYSDWAGPFNFTTPKTVPFFDGFETGNTDNTAIAGWTQQAITGTYVWTANNTLTSYNRAPLSGAWNAFLHYGATRWMFTPIELEGETTYQFKMYARQDGSAAANASIKVSYGLQANAAAMINEIVPETGIINGDYQEISGLFTPVETGTYFVGVLGYINYSPYYISIDDISIDFPPDCVPVSGLTATDITSTSAVLDWTENGEATVWNIEFGEAGFTPSEVPTHAGVDKPFFIDELTSAKSYDFYVQADCGTKDLSSWVGPFTFTTLCEVYNVPFTESFSETLECWSSYEGSAGASAHWSAVEADAAHGSAGPQNGTHFARLDVYNASTSYNPYYFESPAFLLDGADKQLSYYYWLGSSGYQNSPVPLSVELSMDDGANWETLYEHTNENSIFTSTSSIDGWTKNTISLSAYAGETVKFRFVGNSNYGYGYTNQGIDEFTIDDIPPPGTLSGVVTALDSGNPLQGVSVVAEPGTVQTTTNYLGEYELELLEGEYDITFTKADYYPLTETGVSVLSGETTTLSVALETIPAPLCADLVSPTDNANNVFPDAVLEWEVPLGSAPPAGFRISLYNLTTDSWVEEDTDLGKVTTYTPAQPFDWGTDYIWLLTPYNNAGEPEGCAPWTFSTSFAGAIDGYVEDSDSEMPLEGVDVSVVEVFPNSGFTIPLVTGADGKWYLEWETGVYNITFSKFGYFDKTMNTISINIGQVTQLNVSLDPVTPYPMPFFENWNTGSFATQQWTKEGNWVLSLSGFPGPSAYFNWDPEVFDFDMDLTSYFIDGRNETDVFAQFDMYIDDYAYQYGAVTLTFMVYDGVQWNDVATFDNLSGDIIVSPTFDISEYAAGNLFLLGFKAAGEDTWDIDGIYIDNILVTNTIFEVGPEEIADALFFDESSTWDITLENYGISEIEWNAVIDPAATWASLGETSGILAPGSGTVEVTFDATGLAAGTYTTEVIFTDANNIFEKKVALQLQKFDQAGQQIMLPEANQWGYISSYIDVNSKVTLEELFADVIDDMVIMVGNDGIFWPGFEINTLGEYDTYQGYKIKMGSAGALAFIGDMVGDQTVSFNAGMYMIPVLSEEPVSAQAIFGTHNIEFAFGLDGSIYWPAGPVMTLTTLYPGYGYFVKFNEPTTLDFGITPPKQLIPNNPPVFENTSPWNPVYKTSAFHMIGITPEAGEMLEKDDIVGVFNADGLCTGMINYTGSGEALAIPVFVDDITTTEVDGMQELETMNIKIYRNGETLAVNPVFDQNFPNSDGNFVSNGFSVITSFKEGATAIADASADNISIYPNPSAGTFNIEGVNDSFRLFVTNSQGQIVLTGNINGSYQLDLSSQPNGLYFVKLIGDESVKLIKVIKQ